jgi:tRNA(Ile)-lysidine synthase
MITPQLIESALAQCTNPPPRIYIGYSGGVDSHVLLHLCASMPSIKDKITAVYVHHGLQDEADAWAGHCERKVKKLAVAFSVLYADAKAERGESPEEAARNARYSALRNLITTDDVLLIGQHRDDQLETVLLQLFRGSGLRGLSGIPDYAPFGAGSILRPLLNSNKQSINDYAEQHKLSWVEDPSNQSSDYDRNFLRNEVIPLIKQRWQSVDKTVARSARHCAEAQRIVTALADELFNPVFNENDKTLSITQLSVHKAPRQQLTIRHWFQCLGLRMPQQSFVERIISEVIEAAEDSDPELVGQGYSVRRYRDKLYCLKHIKIEPMEDTLWAHGQKSIKLANRQTLYWIPSSQGIDLELWEKSVVAVKVRDGGEKIYLPHRRGSHTLKKLYQEAGIPPWERELIPLVYLDDKLAAIGDRWISSEFYVEKRGGCVSLVLKRG